MNAIDLLIINEILNINFEKIKKIGLQRSDKLFISRDRINQRIFLGFSVKQTKSVFSINYIRIIL